MAKRTISTVVAVDGERQYRDSIAAINVENRNLASALKLVQSEFQNNANSLQALQAKSEALASVEAGLSKKINELKAARDNAKKATEEYRQNIEKLSSQIQKNESELEKLKKTQGDTKEEQEKLNKETTNLNKELKDNEMALSAAEKGVNNWETQLNNAQVELNGINADIDRNAQYMEEAKNGADGCAKSIDRFGKEVKDAGNEAAKAGTQTQEFTQKSSDGMNTLAATITAAGIVEGIRTIGQALASCAQSSISFESAMTGVAKTTNLTGTELEAMGEAVKTMSTEIPMAANDIAAIAENAGQLGIQKENLLDFSRVMADLGVATNLTGEEAAQAFAKFANITGMPQSEFERLGSTVVALGNNLATTEADISNMGMRLAAAGKQAGMSQADILGVAGALSSVGLEAEAGGSAFSKAITNMTVAVQTGSDSVKDFADIAGMSSEEFTKAFQEDATGALLSFISGLDNMAGHGKSAAVMLEELGFTELRLRDALTRAAGANELFSDSVKLGNEAWTENVALSNEAELRYGTTESKLQMLGNSFENVKTTVGDQLNPALEKLMDMGTSLLDWFGEAIESNETIVPLLIAGAAAFGFLAIAVAAYGIAQKTVIPLVHEFNIALNSNPIGMVITLIGMLVSAVAVLALTYDDGIKSTEELTEASRNAIEQLDELEGKLDDNKSSIEATAKAADKYVDKLGDLEEKIKNAHEAHADATDAERQYALIVEELNGLIPDLNLQLNEQTGLVEGGTAAIYAQIDGWRELAVQQAQQELITEALKAQATAEVELAENQLFAADARQAYLEAQQKQNDLIQEYNDRVDELKEKQQEEIEQFGAVMTAFIEGDPVLGEINNKMLQQSDVVASTKTQWEEAADACTVSAENMRVAGDKVTVTEQAVDKLNSGLDKTAQSTGGVATVTATLQQNLETLGISLSDFTASTAGMNDAYREQQSTLMVLEQEMTNLQAAYDEAYEKNSNIINGQIGLFESVKTEVKTSADEMITAWQSQQDFYATYTQNLKTLTKYGVSDGLVAAWSDGSVESAGYIQGVVDKIEELGGSGEGMSKDAQAYVNTFNEEFAKTTKARDSLTTTVTDMELKFSEKMDAMKLKMDEMTEHMNQADKAARAAGDTADSYTNGLRVKLRDLYNMGKSMAMQVNQGWKDAYIQRSPSKLAIKTSGETADSYIMGFEMKRQKLENEGAHYAKTFNTSMVEETEKLLARATPFSIYESSNVVTNNAGKTEIHAPMSFYVTGDTDIKRVAKEVRKEIGRLVRI